MSVAEIEAAAADIAARQHGLVTTSELRELGLNNKAIARRVAKGQWLKLGPTVLRRAGTPVTWESQVLSHVLAGGSGAVASHRSAAVLLGLDGVRRGKPEVTVPAGRRYVTDDARVHYSSDLDRARTVRRQVIPCTAVERTLLDLGAVVSAKTVLLAIDSARRRNLTTWDSLLDTLAKHARRGRNGVATLREILDCHQDELRVTDSGFERLVMVLLGQAGLPKPVMQHSVSVGTRTFRPDLAYPDLKVAIELDGGVHLRRDVWERDHARQNALVLEGWTLLRFTWRDYTEHSARIVSEIRAVLQR